MCEWESNELERAVEKVNEKWWKEDIENLVVEYNRRWDRIRRRESDKFKRAVDISDKK